MDTTNNQSEIDTLLSNASADPFDGAPVVDMGDDMSEFDDDQTEDNFDDDEPFDGTDAEADSEWLASAGMGTDEDYGVYGGIYDE